MKTRNPKPPADLNMTNLIGYERAVSMSEALAQVESQEADGIKERWSEGKSDLDLLVKLAEARQATIAEGLRQPVDLLQYKQQQATALAEILKKAALEVPVQPPKHARFAVFLLPRSYQHIVFGDLEELYPVWLRECGPSKAAFLYWWQFVISTIHIAWPRTRKLRYLTVLICLLTRALNGVHLAVGDILRHLH
jgi:hypothetical protein